MQPSAAGMASHGIADTLPLEIIAMILDLLEDDEKSLTAAISVNKAWADEGSNVFWRRGTASKLAKVSENRRQYYVNKVEHMSLGVGAAEINRGVTRLHFPRLQRLVVSARDQTLLLKKSYL